MAKTRKIEPRTKRFAQLHKELSDKKLMLKHEELAKVLGFEHRQSITEILKQRQNIDEDKWRIFLDRFGLKDEFVKEISLQANEPKESIMESVDFKEKYYALLEKENSVKDRTIEKLSLAVDNIKVVDDKVEKLKTIVDAQQGKWRDYEPIILGLREFVTAEIASLRKQSHEKVAAALDIKVEEQAKKVELSYTQKD